jgi:hypothetical protein
MNWAYFLQNPNGPARYRFAPGGIRFEFEPDMWVLLVRSLIRTEPVRYRRIKIQWRTGVVYLG